MFMCSNGPVSSRRARSGVRWLTQLHTLPFSSGCMVSRNVTVSRSRSSTVAAEYSVNRSGQLGTSLVMSQTSSNGALITMLCSVCPLMSDLLGQAGGDEVRDLRQAHLQGLVRD